VHDPFLDRDYGAQSGGESSSIEAPEKPILSLSFRIDDGRWYGHAFCCFYDDSQQQASQLGYQSISPSGQKEGSPHV